MHKILVTGAAGFIGFHFVERLLLEDDWNVVGLDNINDYYDVNLKYDRVEEAGVDRDKIEYDAFTSSKKHPNYTFIKLDLSDKANLIKLFETEQFDFVVHLAAQVGVRYSVVNPDAYIQSNIIGFANLLECCRFHHIQHLVYASSSSVYGLNSKMPLSTSDNVDHPISLYAATKKSNELMAHTYSYLYNLPTTGVRFFTVYGPWTRPDMAILKFANAITHDKPIDVYNNGEMYRDFTYINDIVEGVFTILTNAPGWRNDLKVKQLNPSVSIAPYKLYNIGNSKPINLKTFIEHLEEVMGKKAEKRYLPLQPGDVITTDSDVSDLEKDFNYRPTTDLKKGIKKFVAWYKSYYPVKDKEPSREKMVNSNL